VKELILILSLCALAISIPYSYFNRYELHLVKPRYKAGDCIQWTVREEFSETKICDEVDKVGETHYRLRWYGCKNGKRPSTVTLYELHIENVDASYEKVQCPNWPQEQE
jgi:hypothetical protein